MTPSDHFVALQARYSLALRADLAANNDASGERLDAARQAVWDYVAQLEQQQRSGWAWLRRLLRR